MIPKPNAVQWPCARLGMLAVMCFLAASPRLEAQSGRGHRPEPEPETETERDPGRVHEHVLGIVPFLPPERLEQTFGHMARRFGEVLGCDVRFRTSSTYQVFEDKVLSERYDFAQLPPSLYLRVDPEVYVAIGRPPGTVRAEFVVLEDSDIDAMRDLAGKLVAVQRGPPFEETVIVTLLEAGLKPERDVELAFFEDPLSCLQQIVAGTASVCVTNAFTRQRFSEQMNVELRVVGYTAELPFGPFVVHRRVPEAEREAIRELMATWREDPRNAPSSPVSGAQVPSLVPVLPGDYDVVLAIEERARARGR